MGLMLMCGGQRVTIDELKAIPVPESTSTYKPIPFGDIVDLIERRVQKEFAINEQDYELGFGVSKDGQRLFGVLSLKEPVVGAKRTPTLGFRSSYNHAFAPALCGGGRVTVCDNLMFASDYLKVVRRQTGNAWGDFELLAMGAIAQLEDHFNSLDRECCSLEDRSLSQRGGWETLGEMCGRRMLTGPQMRIAFEEWNEKFKRSGRDWQPAMELYNAVTVALKKGDPSRLLKQYGEVHQLMRNRYLMSESQGEETIEAD